jgi:hypothetical protein
MLYPYFFGGVLSARQHETLTALARQRGVSKSEVVRQLLEAQAQGCDEEEDGTEKNGHECRLMAV